MRKLKLAVTTAADGTATAFMNKVSGKIHSVQYVKDGANAYTDGVDFTLTAESTGESIWNEANVNASAIRYPRAPVHTQAGAAALYAAGGTAVLDKIAVSNERIKIAVAQGGNAKTGSFVVLVDA
jgi:hypothetical protein